MRPRQRLQERGHARAHGSGLEEVAALEQVRRPASSSRACSTSCDAPSGCCFQSASICSLASFHSGTVVRQ